MEQAESLIKHDNTQSHSSKEIPKDLDKTFLKNLHSFSEETQQLFFALPEQVRRKIFKTEPKEDSNLQVSTGIFGMQIQEGTAKDWERMNEEARRERNEWTKEEIEDMDSARREIITWNILYSLLKSVGDEEFLLKQSKSEELSEIMTNFWSNRGKRNDEMRFYRSEYFSGIQEQANTLETEKETLTEEISRLSKKKHLQRLEVKNLEKLRSQLTNDFADREAYAGPKAKELHILYGELRKEKAEKIWQTSLNYILEYFDATEFATLVSWVLDSRFDHPFYRKKYQKQLEDLHVIIEGWYKQYEKDGSLKQAKDQSSEQKQQKLIEHFWRLFNSHLRLKSDQTTESMRLENTEREFNVVLNLLKKTAY